MAGITRRGVLIGGGAGIGLVAAWGLWPRDYVATLVAGPGEHPVGAWLRLGEDGRIVLWRDYFDLRSFTDQMAAITAA